MLLKLNDPEEKDEEAGVVLDGAELEVGRGEKEKAELAGLAALVLDAKEKEGALGASVLEDTKAAFDAGLPKLKLGRADEVDVEAAAAAAAAAEGGALKDVVDMALVAGSNEVALLLIVLVVLVVAAAAAVAADELLLSILLRCLRYCSRNDSIRAVRSANGSASSCSLTFCVSVDWKEMLRPRSERSWSFSLDDVLWPLAAEVDEGDAAAGAEDTPPRIPEAMLDV